MGLRSWFDDIDEMRTNLSELMAANTAEEAAASRQIAESASHFSRRTREVVDDKLSFSATLMRAGEVSAATRLLAEVEEEVRSEEVALIETVNEVKVAQAVRRGRITRLRLARTLAAAMLGATLLAFSAVGMAVASAFQERDQRVALVDLAQEHRRSARKSVLRDDASSATTRLLRSVRIGDVKLVLTQDEFRRLNALTGGDVDESSLTDVLDLLQGALAQKVENAIAIASEVIDEVPEVVVEAAPAEKRNERSKQSEDKAAQPAEEQPQPSPEPTEQEEPEPEPEPSPSPSESDGAEHGEEGEGSLVTPLSPN